MHSQVKHEKSFITLGRCLSFQGICSAYDIIVACAVDPLQLLGLRKTEKSTTTNGHSNGNSKVRKCKMQITTIFSIG